MIDIALQFCALLGLAVWLPRPNENDAWLGGRFALAGALLPIYLFFGNVLLTVPISVLSGALVFIAVMGLAARAYRSRANLNLIDSVHPIFVLTVLFSGVVMLRGGLDYQPYLGDELASWLNLSKQIYLADDYWSPSMDYHLPSYSNGWPLLIASVTIFARSYSDVPAAVIQFLLHVGIIGFVYDLVRAWLSKNTSRTRFEVILIAWFVIFVYLAGEITWRLLPTDLLIEQPMLYGYAACILIAIVGATASMTPFRMSLYFGAFMCAGYLFKVSMLAIAPAVAIFLVASVWPARPAIETLRTDIGRLAFLFAISFGPTFVAMTVWTLAAAGNQLEGSLGPGAQTDWSLLWSPDGRAVTGAMLDAAWPFVSSYKWPLTLICAIALVFAGANRSWRWIALGFAAFVAATWAGLYLYYIYREPVLVRGYLESFPRFMILPVRLLHLIGFLAIIYAVIRHGASQIDRWFTARAIRIATIATVAVGFAWQARQVAYAAADMADRRYQTPGNIRAINGFKRDIAGIVGEIERAGVAVPRLGIIDSYGYDVAYTSALYYSLKSRRELATASYRFFRPFAVRSPDDIDTFDILWPVSIDPAGLTALASHVADPACAARPTDYILIKSDNGRYVCRNKATKQ